MARSEIVPHGTFKALLQLLSPVNALALDISLSYGARIGDILEMKTESIDGKYWSFKERKTGKRKGIKLSKRHKMELKKIAGKIYVFEHRTDFRKHRTRQAIYKDIKRLAVALGYKHITPHSARKMYAVNLYTKTGNMEKVQKALNHDDPAVTALYALADKYSKNK